MSARGADLLVDALATAGVRHLFSLSGNQILSVYDATVGRDITLIHTRHEAAAVHMADGWARMTEEPGVALVTAGPGHLNAISALYTALMSESPVVLLSGHAPRSQAGRGAFQEMDQVGAARPVSKAAWVVESAERMGEEMTRALALASAWPPGPVHLSLPGDLLEARVSATPAAAPAPSSEPRRMDEVLIRRTLELLAEAKRPLIIAGPAMGRARRSRDVERLSERTGIPALLMESPRGVNDPSLRGATRCLGEADLVLLLGKRLDFTLRFGGPPAFSARSRFIVADVAPPRSSERLALALAANPSVVLRQLVVEAAEHVWQRSTWSKEVEGARVTRPASWEELERSPATPLHPLRVCAALQPQLDAGAILVSDGGEFGQWCQAGLDARDRLINGPAGSIGSAVPMALGAKVARPDLPVIATLGDGTFGFHALEFDTAVRHGIPIVAVVGNDARWNAEHQLQLQQYGAERTIACELRPTRYDQVAAALGAHAEHVEYPADLDAALTRAVESNRPAVINVMIDGVPAPTYRSGAGAH